MNFITLIIALTTFLAPAIALPAAKWQDPWGSACGCNKVGEFCDSNWRSKGALYGSCNFPTLYECSEVDGAAVVVKVDKEECPGK